MRPVPSRPAAMACAVIMRVRCPGLPCEATGACRSLRTCLGRGRLWDPSVCDREDGNTERSTKTRLLGQADRNHANLMHVGLLLLQPRGDREVVLSGGIRGWQANPSEFNGTYLFLFFS